MLHYLATFFNWLFFQIREYLLEGWDGEGFAEIVEDDDGNNLDGRESEVDGGINDVQGKNDQQVLNIHIHDNIGTVVIGERPSINYPHVSVHEPSSATASLKEESSEFKNESLQLSCTKPFLPPSNKPGNEKRKKRSHVNEKPKVPSLVKRIEYIQEELSKNRGEGEWVIHDETIERLLKEYKHDDDNYDVLLLLKYEKAVGLYKRNDIRNSSKFVREVASKISNKEQSCPINETQQWIYLRCLLLVCDIHCEDKNYGIAEKALKEAKYFLNDKYFSSNTLALLETEFHLVHARYFLKQAEQLSNHSRLCCIEIVIEHTKKAEKCAQILKNKQSNNDILHKKLRMEILLIMSNAILKLPEDVYDEAYVEMLKNIFEEMEHLLYNGSLQITKVKYRSLKSCYYKTLGNIEQAIEEAKEGLKMAEESGFPAEKMELEKKIKKLSRGFQKFSCNQSHEVVCKVLHMITTDTGNVESNAVEMSCGGAFSTDAFSDNEELQDVTKFQSIQDAEFPRNEVVERLYDVADLSQQLGTTSANASRYRIDAGTSCSDPDTERKREESWIEFYTIHDEKEEKVSDVVQDTRSGDNDKLTERELPRRDFAKLVEKDLGLFKEVEAIRNRQHQTLQECKESKISESVGGAECDGVLECSLGDRTQAIDFPADDEKLTEREQIRLAMYLNPHWDQLLGLLNIPDYRRGNLTNNVIYPDNISKAKEVLHIYNKRAGFSRKILAKLVMQDLKMLDEANAITSGAYRSISLFSFETNVN